MWGKWKGGGKECVEDKGEGLVPLFSLLGPEQHIRNTFATHSQHICNTFAFSLRPGAISRNTFATHSQHLCFLS
jgi:hypothetical protein